jgi:hypothetical protein
MQELNSQYIMLFLGPKAETIVKKIFGLSVAIAILCSIGVAAVTALVSRLTHGTREQKFEVLLYLTVMVVVLVLIVMILRRFG